MYNEQELIYLYHLGSQIALDILLRIYKQKYQSICQNLYLDTLEISRDDYVQMAMVSFYKSIDNYRFDMNTQVQTYFMHVFISSLKTTNRYFRRKKSIPHDKLMSMYDNYHEQMMCLNLSSQMTSNEPDKQYALKEEITEYRYAFYEKTSPLERQVFDYYQQGYKLTEIAELLNIDIKTVYNANYRIQKKLTKLK